MELKAAARPALLRSREPHAHARVTFVELFFDLVFVFAITQLSHALVHDPTPAGALRAAVLFLAMWWVWIFTSWVTNWLDPDRGPIRTLLFLMMLAGLVLSMAIPSAFGERGLAFALAYTAMQVGRTAFMLWAIGPDDPALRRNFLRILVWLGAASPFWIIGGLVPPDARLGLWAIALAIEYVSPSVYFWVPGLGRSTIGDWQVEGAHLSERCALFIIIALGESILVTGATFAGMAWTAEAAAAFVTAFVGSIAMWWVYFNIGAERGTRHITSAGDPGRMARLGYTYLHLPVVAGIVVAAVGDEMILHHPQGHTDRAAVACILGGPALYLGGLLLFKRIGLGRLPLSHLVGLALLALLLLVAAPVLSPLALAVSANAVLVLVAIWEHLSLRTRQA
jgi:low temperature requirement protein LtrA